MSCGNCGHEWSQHKIIEVMDIDDNMAIGECEVEGCDCKHFEEV